MIEKSFKEILSAFENTEEVQKIKDHFQTGLLAESILEPFKSTRLSPSEEFISLYLWHNGMKNTADGQTFYYLGQEMHNVYIGMEIFTMATLLPLENCFALYENSSKDYPELFPFCYSDDILSINLDKNSKHYNKIYIKNTELLILEPMPIFNSLSDMFLTLTEFFEEKIFYYAPDEDSYDEEELYLVQDDEHSKWIRNKVAPLCDYCKIDDNDFFLSYEYNRD